MDISHLSPAAQAALREGLKHYEDVYHKVLATKYLALAALTVVLQSAIYSFPDEYKHIWNGRRGTERTMFLLHRHVVLVGLFLGVLMSFGVIESDVGCRAGISLVGVVAVLGIGLSDGLVAMEVWQLWDCDPTVMTYMVTAFAVSYTSSVAFIVGSFISTFDAFIYQPQLKVCAFTRVPRVMTGLWVSGMMFELGVFVSTLYNIYSRPRYGDTKVTDMLLRDGGAFFVAVSALRLTNMVIALKGGPEEFFMLIFPVWALVTVLVDRLVLNQSRERYRMRQNVVHMSTDLRGPNVSPRIMISRTIEQELEEDPIEMDTMRSQSDELSTGQGTSYGRSRSQAREPFVEYGLRSV